MDKREIMTAIIAGEPIQQFRSYQEKFKREEGGVMKFYGDIAQLIIDATPECADNYDAKELIKAIYRGDFDPPYAKTDLCGKSPLKKPLEEIRKNQEESTGNDPNQHSTVTSSLSSGPFSDTGSSIPDEHMEE